MTYLELGDQAIRAATRSSLFLLVNSALPVSRQSSARHARQWIHLELQDIVPLASCSLDGSWQTGESAQREHPTPVFGAPDPPPSSIGTSQQPTSHIPHGRQVSCSSLPKDPPPLTLVVVGLFTPLRTDLAPSLAPPPTEPTVLATTTTPPVEPCAEQNSVTLLSTLPLQPSELATSYLYLQSTTHSKIERSAQGHSPFPPFGPSTLLSSVARSLPQTTLLSPPAVPTHTQDFALAHPWLLSSLELAREDVRCARHHPFRARSGTTVRPPPRSLPSSRFRLIPAPNFLRLRQR